MNLDYFIPAILTVLEGLHDLRVWGLAFNWLEERYEEKLILGVFSEIFHSVASRTSIHHCHHVVLLWASRKVSEPDVHALDILITTEDLKKKTCLDLRYCAYCSFMCKYSNKYHQSFAYLLREIFLALSKWTYPHVFRIVSI